MCDADAHCSSAAPSGTPRALPITKGTRRGSFAACRNFHTETPCTIRAKAASRDQRRDLRGRQEMQPHRRGDDAEAKAGKAGDIGGGKSANRE